MKRLGIIGCGRVVDEFHAPSLNALARRVRVTAISDPAPRRREIVGDRFKVPEKSRYSDYRRMLENEKLDFVDVAVPHSLHEDAVIAAAEYGVNVLTEKPLTVSMGSARRIIKAVKSSKIHFGIMHNYRYEAYRQKAFRLLREGKLGKPFFLRFEQIWWSNYAATPDFRPHWRSESAFSGGGALIDNGYHYIYLAEEFMRSPIVKVYARIGTFVKKQDVDDLAVVTFTHKNGGMTSLQISWGIHSGGRSASELHGTKGSLWFNYDKVPLQFFDNLKQRWTKYPVKGTFQAGFTAVFREYLDSLEGKKKFYAGPEVALRTIAIVMAAYKSGREGRVVNLSELGVR